MQYSFTHIAAFLLSVSELLMGEVDSSTLLSLLPTEKSRVSERLSRSYPYFPSASLKN